MRKNERLIHKIEVARSEEGQIRIVFVDAQERRSAPIIAELDVGDSLHINTGSQSGEPLWRKGSKGLRVGAGKEAPSEPEPTELDRTFLKHNRIRWEDDEEEM